MCSMRRILLGSLAALAMSIPAAAEDDYAGHLQPYQVVKISSQVPGIVDTVTVERGDHVCVGQVLVELRAGLEAATVERAKAQLQFAVRRAERNEALSSKELISRHQTDELETEARIARLVLGEAEERLAMRTIRSPLNGVVVERSRSPGEFVGQDPVLTIARIDPLTIEVILPAARFGSIRRGLEAKVMPEAPIGGEYTASVTIVDEVIDAASGTFGVRLELPNADYALPAGLRCTVRFPGSPAP